MKASELRIGNCVVNSYGNEALVESIHPNIGLHNEWKPIALTDQWFDNFGFNRYADCWSHPKGLDIVLANKKSGGQIVLVPNPNYCMELELVHQLQNLYFALTSKELSLK